MKGSIVFVITGPSGSGKSTLVKLLLNSIPDIYFTVSHTTRESRPNELNGTDYYFVSEEKFKKMINQEKFLEWAIVHGNYYGTSHSEINRGIKKGIDLLLDLDIQGAMNIRKKLKNCVFIFVVPPSINEIKKRIILRGTEDESEIGKRLKNAKNEIKKWKSFEYIVINDSLKRAVYELQSIINAERAKRFRREEKIKELFLNFY
ncbi:MAG: guanylate kinase [Acidobacteriota bacterium]